MTDRYAVIGNPIGHSKSPLIHAQFARQCAQDLTYSALECTAAEFANTVRSFRDSGARGLNVTAPFKLQAFELADRHSERASLTGASNALKFEAGHIHAENFDGVGLVNDIQRNLGGSIAGRRVLLLGAGGAARGALGSILEQRPSEVTIANRSVSKAVELAAQFAKRGTVHGVGYANIGEQAFDVIINATSASVDDKQPLAPRSVFTSTSLAYEMAYGRGLTPFLRWAKEAGVTQLADGIGMLIEQAAEAFLWWRGVRPDTAPLIRSLTIPLV